MNSAEAIAVLREALSNLEKEFVRVFPIYYYSEPWAHDKNIQLAQARAALASTEHVEDGDRSGGDGFVLAPKEPTQAMHTAGFSKMLEVGKREVGQIYKAMLSAAPTVREGCGSNPKEGE
jgi:hypothetical protein